MELSEIIDVLTEKRIELGIRQDVLAEKSGIQHATLARLECHLGKPQFETIAKIAKNLGYDIVLIPKEHK